MSKHVPRSPSPTPRAPVAAATCGNTQPKENAGLNEGDGVILGVGGIPRGSPANQRQALIAVATAGNADAQCRMGDLCRNGDEFTEQGFAEAVRWYAFAANQGDPRAQDNLGSMYYNGVGVPKDMAEAAKWYRLSAEQGLSVAQFNLALCLLCDAGPAHDEQEAAAWLHKAAAQGHIDAIAQLGTLYQVGAGVERAGYRLLPNSM